MARRWEVFNQWEGGGFFDVGSFEGGERFNALNMQRYKNGSIGPRPKWRKLTNSTALGATVSSVPAADIHELVHGFEWSSYGPSTASFGVFLLVHGGGTDGRRVTPTNAGEAVFNGATNFGQRSSTDLKLAQDAVATKGVQLYHDGSNPVYVGGGNILNADSMAITTTTARTINAASFVPNKLVIYRNRMYGWQPLSGSNPEYIVYSRSTDFSNFSGEDSGDFRVSAAPSTFSPAVPRGLWALNSGLLIFTTEGPVRLSKGYPGVTTEYADFGRWYMLSGFDVISGSLTPLDYDMGPAFHSLSLVHDGRVLFPIHNQGWAIHDGQAVDKNIMASVRPGRGQDVGVRWLAPAKTYRDTAIILPWKVTSIDDTASGTGNADRVGEFWNHGYGAYEWVNGAWTESLYHHGRQMLPQITGFDQDKLALVMPESSDGGTNYSPAIYTRDVTLNRPSHSLDVWSSATEDAPAFSDSDDTTSAAGTTGDIPRFVETAERYSQMGNQLTLSAIVVEYDFWNSALFDDGCGFDIEVVYRSARGYEKHTQQVASARITPGSTSVGELPKRERFVTNINQIRCGTFQVRITNVVGVAVHEIAVAVEEGDPFI